jgi:hypothetical protein
VPLFQRQLSVNITGQGVGSGFNTQGLRTSARIVQTGGRELTSADVRIWGVPLNIMNAVSTIGYTQGRLPNNSITVTAIDDLGSNVVFIGQVQQAVADFQGGANLPLHIVAFAGLQGAYQNTQGTTKQGQADATQLLGQLAGQIGVTFENNGLSNVNLMNPWYARSPLQQIHNICNDCNLDYTIALGKLAVWQKSGFRNASSTTSPTTGMVGYPSFSSLGIRITTLFNPAIEYGGMLTVTGSAITPANKTWKVFLLTQELDAFLPNGKWFTVAECGLPENQTSFQ